VEGTVWEDWSPNVGAIATQSRQRKKSAAVTSRPSIVYSRMVATMRPGSIGTPHDAHS